MQDTGDLEFQDFQHTSTYSAPQGPKVYSGMGGGGSSASGSGLAGASSSYGSNYGSRPLGGYGATPKEATSPVSSDSSSSIKFAAAPVPVVVQEEPASLEGDYSGVDFGSVISADPKPPPPPVVLEGEDPTDGGKFWKIAFYRYACSTHTALDTRHSALLTEADSNIVPAPSALCLTSIRSMYCNAWSAPCSSTRACWIAWARTLTCTAATASPPSRAAGRLPNALVRTLAWAPSSFSYGPFWIASTLIFLLGAFGNFATYLDAAVNNSGAEWHYDFAKVTIGALIIYIYITIVPIGLWTVFKWRDIPIGLLENCSVYGYSLFPYLPTAVRHSLARSLACLIEGVLTTSSPPPQLVMIVPSGIARWIIIMLAFALVSGFLVRNYLPKMRAQLGAAVPLLLVMVVLNLGLAIAFRMYFFEYVATVKPSPPPPPPAPAPPANATLA